MIFPIQTFLNFSINFTTFPEILKLIIFHDFSMRVVTLYKQLTEDDCPLSRVDMFCQPQKQQLENWGGGVNPAMKFFFT